LSLGVGVRHQASGDVSKLEVCLLRELDQQTEGGVGVQVVSRHQQALRLSDLQAGDERLPKLHDLLPERLCTGRSRAAVICRMLAAVRRLPSSFRTTPTIIGGVSTIPSRKVAISPGEESAYCPGIPIVADPTSRTITLSASRVTTESGGIPVSRLLVPGVCECVPVGGDLVPLHGERS